MEPHPVDIHVGRRLRSRRTILGMSQEEIGDAVGITFQQVQKYERGLNRIGSSRLFEFACLLGVGVSYFFEDLKQPESDDTSDNNSEQSDQLNNKEVLTLVRSYYGIADPKIRKKVLSLIKAMSASDVDITENNVSTDKKLASVS